MKACRYAKRFKGTVSPRCNGGLGCDECRRRRFLMIFAQDALKADGQSWSFRELAALTTSQLERVPEAMIRKHLPKEFLFLIPGMLLIETERTLAFAQREQSKEDLLASVNTKPTEVP